MEGAEQGADHERVCAPLCRCRPPHASQCSAVAIAAAACSVTITSWTPDLNAVVFQVSGATRPPEFYLLRNGKLAMLAKAFPDIDAAALGKG